MRGLTAFVLGSIVLLSSALPAALPGFVLRSAADLDPLIGEASERRLVLLGESTHGTEEFYEWRRLITQRLIEEKGFRIVAVEGDYASLALANAYVQGRSSEAIDVIMRGFDRWPEWMWRNDQTRELIRWMRAFNEGRSPEERAGFYGIDVYGWDKSLAAISERENDPGLAEDRRAQVASLLATMQPFSEDLALLPRAPWQIQRAVQEEVDRFAAGLRKDYTGMIDPSEEERRKAFELKQHALVLQSAAQHFRLMALGGASSWNARVDHFKQTVVDLKDHYGEDSRAIVWAHNTHVGDARATPMSRAGQTNIGQLARQRWGEDQVYIVGFATGRGTVVAGRAWGATPEVMELREARPDSLDGFLVDWAGSDEPRGFLFSDPAVRDALGPTRRQRAVGVVFEPENEQRNYVVTNPLQRYDSLLFFPETRALRGWQE
jgi:erythromycin esterase